MATVSSEEPDDVPSDDTASDEFGTSELAGDYDAAIEVLRNHYCRRSTGDVGRALGVFIRGHYDAVRTYFRTKLSGSKAPADDVEDLTAQTFEKFARSVLNGRWNPDHPGKNGRLGLLFTIAPQRLADYWYEQGREPASLEALVDGTPGLPPPEDKPWGRGLPVRRTRGRHTDPTWDETEEKLTREALIRAAGNFRLDPLETAVLVLGYELVQPPARLVADMLGIEPTPGGRSPDQQVHDIRSRTRAKIGTWSTSHPHQDPTAQTSRHPINRPTTSEETA